MKIDIIGLPQAGQQQLFSILTGINLETINQKPLEVQKGICEVRDPHVAVLSKMYNPKKTAFAKIEYSLLPDFNLQGPAKALVFTELKNADEICWVSRGETAKEDVESFISELIISDLMLVEKRLETIGKDQKRKFSDLREKEKALMLSCKTLLDQTILLKDLKIGQEEKKHIRAFQFLTLKPIVVAVNIVEGRKEDKELVKYLKDKYDFSIISLCVELEQEICCLGEDERNEFMNEIGLDEPAVDKMTRAAFSALGLISFYTVGEDEVRAWPVRIGANAVEAGGTIHSDIAKGFVRAEMMKYDDLISAGSEAKVKETGKFSLKGRDYIVEDGDILSFRFNV
jgi:hypothetical protein